MKEQREKKDKALKESVFALPEYTEAELRNIASSEAEQKARVEKDKNKKD